MTFQDDNGNELEVMGAIAMTKQAVSFFNGSIRGDVSTNFSVDNNSENREVLGYYGPQMTSQVAWTKQAFSRVRNGNVLDRGYIVIQSETEDSLSCFYVSGNSNWVQLLNGLITELDYTGVTNGTDYGVIFSSASIISLRSATDKTIFPMIDWGYDLNKGNNVHFMIAGTIYGEPVIDFYPCFYLSTLINEVMSQSGIKISGNILNDPIYKSLIVTPTNGQIKRSTEYNITAFGADQVITGSLVKYNSFTSEIDPNNRFSSSSFTSSDNQMIRLKLSDLLSVGSNTYLYKNGAQIEEFGSGPGIIRFDVFNKVLLSRGDVLEIYTDTVATVRFNLYIEQISAVDIGDYVYPNFYLPSLKSLDILKFCINYFGCATYYNEYSMAVTCNIIEKIKTEDAEDWSEYFVSSRQEYTVNQAKNNYLRLASNTTDSKIVAYNNDHKLKFGEGNLETANTLKNENEIFRTPFAASISGASTNGEFSPNIPLVNLVDGDLSTFTSITNLTAGRSQFNGVVGSYIYTGTIFRLSNGTDDLGYFVVEIGGTTSFTAVYTFTATFAGTIWRQQVNYNTITPRILSVKPNTNIADFSSLTAFKLTDSVISIGGDYTTIPYATFTKPVISDGIDQWKNNLAIDNPDSGGYTDPTIKELYFNKISRFLQNPNIRATFILPEAVYQRFQFDQFIYLKTERLTGYFFVDSIVNYVDSNTPVEVNLYML